ncbi:MAG TPA: hypothetical protein VGN34_10215 [Ktedonobacteraceae bacterium]
MVNTHESPISPEQLQFQTTTLLDADEKSAAGHCERRQMRASSNPSGSAPLLFLLLLRGGTDPPLFLTSRCPHRNRSQRAVFHY